MVLFNYYKQYRVTHKKKYMVTVTFNNAKYILPSVKSKQINYHNFKLWAEQMALSLIKICHAICLVQEIAGDRGDFLNHANRVGDFNLCRLLSYLHSALTIHRGFPISLR